jgi:hypothetical protein
MPPFFFAMSRPAVCRLGLGFGSDFSVVMDWVNAFHQFREFKRIVTWRWGDAATARSSKRP